MEKNINNDIKLSLSSQLLLGFFFMVVGAGFVLRENLFMWSLLYRILQTGLILGVFVFAYRFARFREWAYLFLTLGCLTFLGTLFYKQESFNEFLALTFGIWAVFNGCVHLFELYIAMIKKHRGKFLIVVLAIADLGMGSVLIKSGIDNFFLINLQVGVYLMIFGFTQLLSTYRIVIRDELGIRMRLPIIFTALLPSILAKRLNDNYEEMQEFVREKVDETLGDYISIYIYVKDHGYNRMGHIDIGYNGAIYSYGCYDPFERVKTQAYGAGILIVGSEAEFVQYCIDDNTTVIRYLCKLTPQQRDIVEMQISKLMNDAYFYDYPLKRSGARDSYLGFLKESGVKVDFYKFNSGAFKTYNVFTTNCVIMVDFVLQATGMHLLHLSGVITPGTYYEYLNRNLNKPGSIVIKKEIYRKGTLSYKE